MHIVMVPIFWAMSKNVEVEVPENLKGKEKSAYIHNFMNNMMKGNTAISLDDGMYLNDSLSYDYDSEIETFNVL